MTPQVADERRLSPNERSRASLTRLYILILRMRLTGVRGAGSKHHVSPKTIHRIWQRFNLKPHLIETFKLSKDKHFFEKLEDVVGLYLNPPDKALVFCFDEKSQIQALDRTRPILPLAPGIPAKQTHDYIRHGTTTLFAALSMLDGTVIGECMPRHRHQDSLSF